MKLQSKEQRGGTISVGGKEYRVDSQGVVDAPDDAAVELKGHGFTPYAAPADDEHTQGRRGR